MWMLRFGLLLVLLVVLSAVPAAPMMPTADDFPDDSSAEADACAELLAKIDASRPITVQISESDELQQFLRKHGIGDVRRCLRKIRGAEIPKQGVAAPAKPEVRLGDIDRPYVAPGSRCDRPIPSKQEFLRMLKERPADAGQILRRCNVPIKSISPIRQLPVGMRQLPVDTRQRPVDTW